MELLVTIMLAWFVLGFMSEVLGIILRVTHLDKPLAKLVNKILPDKPRSMSYRNTNRE